MVINKGFVQQIIDISIIFIMRFISIEPWLIIYDNNFLKPVWFKIPEDNTTN